MGKEGADKKSGGGGQSQKKEWGLAFLLLCHDGGLRLLCVGHSLAGREVHVDHLGYAQLHGSPSMGKHSLR